MSQGKVNTTECQAYRIGEVVYWKGSLQIPAGGDREQARGEIRAQLQQIGDLVFSTWESDAAREPMSPEEFEKIKPLLPRIREGER